MFISNDELRTVIQEYQMYDIADNDDSILLTCINTAIEEVRSYLTPSYKKSWNDGRILYDVEAIFAAEGEARNALIVEHTKNVALWYLIRRSNAEIIYTHVKDRYDFTIKFLGKLQTGENTMSSLPQKDATTTTPNYYRFGSITKQRNFE